MRRGLLVFGLISILLVSFVSAGWFDDFFGKITGHVVVDGCGYLSEEVINKINELRDQGKNVVLEEGVKVYEDYYAVLPTSSSEGGVILRFYQSYNDSGIDYSNDEVVFRDALTDDLTEVYFTSEGKGSFIVNGYTYSVEYSEGPDYDDDYVIIDFPQSSGSDKMNFEGCEISIECVDSDGGKNYSEKGTVTYGDASGTDSCSNDVLLYETFCDTPTGLITPPFVESYDCSTEGKVCEEGACVEETPEQVLTCSDSDGGKDYYEKGRLEDPASGGAVYDDFCLDEGGAVVEKGTKLREHYCGENNYQYEYYECPYGCEDGACMPNPDEDCEEEWECSSWSGCVNGLKTKTCTDKNACGTVEDKPDTSKDCVDEQNLEEKPEGNEEFNPTDETGPIELPENLDYVCNGCELNKKCYPIGYRTSRQYCSDSFEFQFQSEKNEECNNNFECSSNVCVSGKCISENLIQKILNWFRKVFGVE